MKLYTLLFFSILLTGLSSCRSRLHFTDYYNKEKIIPPIGVKTANLEKSERIALIMPPDRQEINWEETELVKNLVDKDFGIIITQTHSEDPLIDRDTWISYAFGAYSSLQEDSLIPLQPDNFLVIAFEDAGYIIPRLFDFISPDFYFAVNTGTLNPLQELELLVEDTSASLDNFFENNNVLNRNELKVRIRNVKTKDPYINSLGYKNNHYWLSFYDNDALFQSLKKVNTPGMFIYSENYSSIRKVSRAFMEPMLMPGPLDSTTAVIPGKGNFSEPVEMEALTKVINVYLSTLR